jgi:hypothetical protein
MNVHGNTNIMNVSKKGVGGLSRKLLTILVLSATMVPGLGVGADNSIYIDQAGDGSTIAMTQDGAGNRVRGIQSVGNTGDDKPSIIKGDNINVNIQQIGSGNVLNMGIDTTTANGGNPTDVRYKVQGSNAIATINLNQGGGGVNASTYLDIDQAGDGARANINILGTGNTLGVQQSGGNNNKITAAINADSVLASVNQTLGGGNETSLSVTSNKGNIDLVTLGSTNITSITQTNGTGSIGQNAKLLINGSGNTTTVTQDGVLDHQTDLKITGSGNTVSVSQQAGDTTGQYAKVDLDTLGGSPNSVTIDQRGAVDNTANIKIRGGGNTVTINQRLTP